MDFERELSEAKDLIDKEIEKLFIQEGLFQDKILQSMKYSLSSGGKRLRPIMALKSFQMFSDNLDEILPFALAIELIHTYSLVHDDLPSMDDDDYRRGRPTSHKVYGDAMAILTGDGLLNYAFEHMLAFINSRAKTLEDYKRYNQAMEEIARYGGVFGMIGGQVVDICATSQSISKEELLFMYKAKTGGLIKASLVVGGLVGGARPEEVQVLREFGLNLGMAYQIRDDILDLSEDQDIDKFTYLSFYDLDKARQDVINYSKASIENLNSLKFRDTNFLAKLTNSLVSREI